MVFRPHSFHQRCPAHCLRLRVVLLTFVCVWLALPLESFSTQTFLTVTYSPIHLSRVPRSQGRVVCSYLAGVTLERPRSPCPQVIPNNCLEDDAAEFSGWLLEKVPVVGPVLGAKYALENRQAARYGLCVINAVCDIMGFGGCRIGRAGSSLSKFALPLEEAIRREMPREVALSAVGLGAAVCDLGGPRDLKTLTKNAKRICGSSLPLPGLFDEAKKSYDKGDLLGFSTTCGEVMFNFAAIGDLVVSDRSPSGRLFRERYRLKCPITVGRWAQQSTRIHGESNMWTNDDELESFLSSPLSSDKTAAYDTLYTVSKPTAVYYSTPDNVKAFEQFLVRVGLPADTPYPNSDIDVLKLKEKVRQAQAAQFAHERQKARSMFADIVDTLGLPKSTPFPETQEDCGKFRKLVERRIAELKRIRIGEVSLHSELGRGFYGSVGAAFEIAPDLSDFNMRPTFRFGLDLSKFQS